MKKKNPKILDGDKFYENSVIWFLLFLQLKKINPIFLFFTLWFKIFLDSCHLTHRTFATVFEIVDEYDSFQL